jgi:hypothetical protein
MGHHPIPEGLSTRPDRRCKSTSNTYFLSSFILTGWSILWQQLISDCSLLSYEERNPVSIYSRFKNTFFLRIMKFLAIEALARQDYIVALTRNNYIQSVSWCVKNPNQLLVTLMTCIFARNAFKRSQSTWLMLGNQWREWEEKDCPIGSKRAK